MPIVNRKINGATRESIVISKTSRHNTAATMTYTGISCNAKSLISVTTPDIPLAYTFFATVARISAMASIVSSADVVESKNAIIIVASPLKKDFCKSSGNISIGIFVSSISSYQSTSFTWSIPSTCFSIFAASFIFISSTTIMEKAPIPNSSTIMSCPSTVSRVLGR